MFVEIFSAFIHLWCIFLDMLKLCVIRLLIFVNIKYEHSFTLTVLFLLKLNSKLFIVLIINSVSFTCLELAKGCTLCICRPFITWYKDIDTTWQLYMHMANQWTYLGQLKYPFCSQLINFLNKHLKKLAYIYYNKCFLCRNLCWVWKKNTTTILVFLISICLQVVKIFYDWPNKYYFWWFQYMITRL